MLRLTFGMHAGHVHAYERNYQTLNYKLQGCAPRWITMGESAAACLFQVPSCQSPASVYLAALMAYLDIVTDTWGQQGQGLGFMTLLVDQACASSN